MKRTYLSLSLCSIGEHQNVHTRTRLQNTNSLAMLLAPSILGERRARFYPDTQQFFEFTLNRIYSKNTAASAQSCCYSNQHSLQLNHTERKIQRERGRERGKVQGKRDREKERALQGKRGLHKLTLPCKHTEIYTQLDGTSQRLIFQPKAISLNRMHITE